MRPAILACSALIALAGSHSCAQKVVTTGTFVDRSGASHRWSITASHALVWDGAAYIPVGGTFAPRYLAEGQTAANWAADTKGLEMLKQKGLLDILIDPGVSLAALPPEAVQKVIDYLEAGGFRYGLMFGAGIPDVLSGTVVKPASYRLSSVRDGQDLVWDVPDADSARYIVVDTNDSTQVDMEGQARVRDGVVSFAARGGADSGCIALLYPHQRLKAGDAGGLPDLWAGFGTYRDKLLQLFGSVKFGSGLRFFLDPLANPLTLTGEAESFIPDTPAFLMEWEAFLARHYNATDALVRAWSLGDADIKDFHQAARLIPLWQFRTGVPFVLDTLSGKRYPISGATPKMWDDLRDFRDESVSYYMSAAADVLKKEVADVPVVYTRTAQHRAYINADQRGGFDGLGIAAYARGSALVTGGADTTYSQSEDSAKTIWCLVTETLDTDSAHKPTLGYSSQQSMALDLDWLRGMGAKGVFVNGFQRLPDSKYANYQLLRAPEQLDWLKAYATRMQGDARVAGARPRILQFPAGASGIVQSGPIQGTDVVWVPSLAAGSVLDFFGVYTGYTIALPEGDTTVLWSLRGPKETHLYVPNPARFQAFTADLTPVPFKIDVKKHQVTLVLDDAPRLIRAEGQDIVPIEAIENGLKQLKYQVVKALDAGLAALDYRYQYERADKLLKDHNILMAVTTIHDALQGVVALAQPYIWRECERADSQHFTEAAKIEGASGGMALVLNTTTRPGPEGFDASYKITATSEGEYTVWIACSPPGPETSPFIWSVDDGARHSSADAIPTGTPYVGDRFGWLNLGRLRLAKGAHTLTIHVADPAPGSNRYALAMDALLLTKGAFQPRGIRRPSLPEDPAKFPGSKL